MHVILTSGLFVPQVLSLWDWTVEGETPVCSVTLHGATGIQVRSLGIQNHLRYEPILLSLYPCYVR